MTQRWLVTPDHSITAPALLHRPDHCSCKGIWLKTGTCTHRARYPTCPLVPAVQLSPLPNTAQLSHYSGVSVHLGSYPHIPVYLLVWVWLCPWLYLGTSLPNPEQIRGGGHKTRHKYPDHSCFYPGR